MKLQAKIFLIVISVMAVTGALGGRLVIYIQDRLARSYYQQHALNISEAVAVSLEQNMLRRDLEGIREAILRVGGSRGISLLAIWNSQGVLVASSAQGDMGIMAQKPVVSQVLATQAAITGWETIGNRHEFTLFRPVMNKPACQVCHESGQYVLGVIQVGIDIAPLEAGLRAQALTTLASVLSGFLIIVVAMTLLFRRLIASRLFRLVGITEKVANGDYSAKSKEKGKDEIAELGRSVDNMTDQLETRTKELLTIQRELAQRVEQREQEIRAQTQLNLKALNERIEYQEEATKRGERLSRLYRMIAIASQPDAFEMAQDFLGTLLEELEVEYGSLTTVNPDGSLGKRADSFRGMQPFTVHSFPRGLVEEILRTGQSQYIADAETDPRANPTLMQAGIRSYIGLALRAEGRIVGILFLHSTQTDAFRDKREPLESIAAVLAVPLLRSVIPGEQR